MDGMIRLSSLSTLSLNSLSLPRSLLTYLLLAHNVQNKLTTHSLLSIVHHPDPQCSSGSHLTHDQIKDTTTNVGRGTQTTTKLIKTQRCCTAFSSLILPFSLHPSSSTRTLSATIFTSPPRPTPLVFVHEKSRLFPSSFNDTHTHTSRPPLVLTKKKKRATWYHKATGSQRRRVETRLTQASYPSLLLLLPSIGAK